MIEITCVDFVRFTWLNKDQDGVVGVGGGKKYDYGDLSNLDYDAILLIKFVEDGEHHYSNPTIWVGVAPNTLSAVTAFEATKGIRAFLNGLNITEIDIAYRETVPEFSAGPVLFAPVDTIIDIRRDFIDPISVALSLPIAGLKTKMQGTMGPYFHVGETLYAITARHNLFPANASNNEFTFNGA